MVLREWRPMRRNTFRGFAVIELPTGLVIGDVSIHEKGGRFWASLPARPMLDQDGQQIRNHAGQVQYAAVLEWRNRDLANRFSRAVVELVRREHPGALGCCYAGVGRSKFYDDILPRLRTVKIGRRNLVVLESLDQLIDELLAADPVARKDARGAMQTATEGARGRLSVPGRLPANIKPAEARRSRGGGPP
jgi:hypothetical protein